LRILIENMKQPSPGKTRTKLSYQRLINIKKEA